MTEHPRVLVVEDHALVAMLTRDMVEACGCAAVGPFGSVAGALRAVHETPLDGAVLDIHLQGERVWPVAEALQERRVPFLFLSAYTTREVPEQFRKHPLLSKPISLFGLSTVLKGIGTIRPDPPATS